MSGILGDILAAVTQRQFWSEERIKKFVRDRHYAAAQRNNIIESRETKQPILSDSRAMLIFYDEKRQMWLIVDQMKAFGVLDARVWDRPRIDSQADLVSMIPRHINEDRSEQVGVLSFGDRPQKWLYSKQLFLNDPPKQAIERFLSPPNVKCDNPV